MKGGGSINIVELHSDRTINMSGSFINRTQPMKLNHQLTHQHVR